MPYVNVKITKEGATAAQKAQAIREMADVLVRVLGKNPATTFIVIEEVDTNSWGIGGSTATNLHQRDATQRQGG